MPKKPPKAVVGEAIANLPRLSVDQAAVVGVSGGRDSVALLHALVHAGYRQLVVGHLDHGLRPESQADAQFVAELAESYQLPFETYRVDVHEIAGDQKLSLEAAAREARYEFFALVAQAYWAPRILLAHHADDQVETLLFNLCRGSGRAGLAAMQRLSVREVRGARLDLHRPLLGIWRSDIDTYVKMHRLKFVEDSSNQDRQFARNRVRHDLLPSLETTFGRNVRRSLLRTAEILAGEEVYLSAKTPRHPPGPIGVVELKCLPVALQRRALFAWLDASGIRDIGFDDVENVRALLTELTPAKVNLASNRHVRRRSGEIFIE
jgi:tRNA(Ile)-lysidine synthase